MIKTSKKLICLMLSLSLIFALTGCEGRDDDKEEEKEKILRYNGAVNTTIDPQSKWYNSSIYGAIDASLDVDIKDDFYTAVNKEWIVNHEAPTEDDEEDDFVTQTSEKSKERLINIISGMDDEEALNDVSIDIPREELRHNLELVMQFAGAAADWDSRNKAGAEPLRPYIEAIESISSMEDMNRYIADFEGDNLSFEYMLEVASIANLTEADAYQTIIVPAGSYSLYNIKYYMDMDIFGRTTKRKLEKVVNNVLSDLGYSEEDISRILTECYKFEGMLADHTNTALNSNMDSFRVGYSLDELDDMSGAYPIGEIIRAIGYDITEDFRLTDKSYLRYLGRIYNESNLGLMRSYYIVHTVNAAARLLDRDNYDAITQMQSENDNKIVVSTVPSGDGDRSPEEIRDEWDLVLSGFVRECLAGPLDIIYVSRYCSNEQKQKITGMVDEIIDKYYGVIDSAEWLSPSAREAAKEKLDHITVRVLYPDDFDSYLGLTFEEDDDLLEMTRKINCYQARINAREADTKPDRDLWNLDNVSTSVSNAYYMPSDNSINILAGIISTGDIFDPDREEEINMAYIGTIIGHEISHAFDSTGCYYDKSGNQKRWWDIDDLAAFQMKVNSIDSYYSNISPYPGAPVLTNARLSGEAIADMGGMQIMLELAKDRPGFDYDLFFRSYAELWRNSCSLGIELARIEEDPHPLAFLRTNVTLTQFDEFLDTYGISPGDGMYLEKEKRIKVW